MKTHATLLALLALLPACAPHTRDALRRGSDSAAMTRQAEEELQKQPAIVKVKLRKGDLEVREPALSLPAARDIEVDVDFTAASFDQVVYSVAKTAGMNVLFQKGAATGAAGTGAAAGAAAAKRPITIAYSGKLSEFLHLLAQSSGHFLRYEQGGIVVRETDSFNISVPAYPELLKEVEANLKALGASDVAYDRFSSTLSFSADHGAYQRVKGFCSTLRSNAALVSMRVMLMNVKLTDDRNAGIDWTKLIYGVNSQKAMNAFGQRLDGKGNVSVGTDANGATTVTANTAPIDAAAAVATAGQALVMNSTGANLLIESTRFSLSALLNFIDSYGSYRIMQNAAVLAMSGAKGRLDVLTETPYVSEISLSALSNQAATATQSVKTDKAKSGVEMDLVPHYSREDGVLTMSLKVSVLGVTRFISLEAGQLIGRITQPETTRKSIETHLRMSPYQTAVIGGLVYEQSTSAAAGLPGESLASKSYSSQGDREELVVVVRPTVIEFEL